jgi:hypothetical protein
MAAPVTVNMAAFTGPWPGFTISGVTGTGAASINGNYALLGAAGEAGERTFAHVNGLCVVQDAGGGLWDILLNAVAEFAVVVEADWPWLVAAWSAENLATGTPAFARWEVPPGTVEQSGAATRVDATLTTALTGTNNDIKFNSKLPGRLGNGISIRLFDPAAINASLVASVTGLDFTFSLATGAGGAITTTASQILTAVENLSDDDAYISATNAPGNDGTGVVTAMAKTYLTGGEGGLPLPPGTVAI